MLLFLHPVFEIEEDMKKHVNIPVFVPHMGCPNNCVFCDQRQISGHTRFSIELAKKEIEEVLAVLPQGTESEIAFFGGSFTGIERELFLALCALGKEYVDSGRVSKLRCSTRPDYINREVLDTLKKSGFATIELGVQSVDGKVLEACKRGHSREITEKACEMIVKAGLELGGQMMVGLPGSTPESEKETAEFICKAGAKEARVYPTVVFPATELADMLIAGSYVPLDVESAVERTADLLEIFDSNSVKVIRVGLCESEGLRRAVAGPNIPDLGERAMSRVCLRRVYEALQGVDTCGKNAVIEVAPGQTSKMCGHKRSNILKLAENLKLNAVKVIEKTDIIGYNIKVNI